MNKQSMEHFKGSENILYGIIVMETHHYVCACVLSCFSSVQLCATPLDYSPSGSSVHGVL